MSQVIDLCEDSGDDNDDGEWPNAATLPSLKLTRKRPREKEESVNDPHFRNENGKRSAKNDTAGKATVKDVGSEEADPRESHEGIAVAASHPMNSDSEQTSQDDGSGNKYSHKLSTSKPLSNVSRRQGRASAWEARLSELADYRKIHGHCNVPANYSEKSKLGNWVSTQRTQYRLHLEGKTSSMTLSRIQELESLGFEWVIYDTAWENRLSELADYRKIHGHCNVPANYSEKSKLGKWVGTQRTQYRLHLEGKTSSMTLSRIQELEGLGFEWKLSTSRRQGAPKKPSLDDELTRVRERAMEPPELMQKIAAVEKSVAMKSTSLSKPKKKPTGMAKSTLTLSRVEPKKRKRVEAGDARFDETDLHGSPSELAAKPNLCSDRQIAKSLSPDKLAPAGDSVESITRKDALQAKLPQSAHQQKSINSFAHALVVAGPPENGFLVAAKKPANSTQVAESLLKAAPSNEMLRANPVAAEPLQQRHNVFTHALLLGDGSAGNSVQTNPDKPANSQPDMQQTPPDEVFQSDNVLNEVEFELSWLGEESMYCLSCPEFQFNFIYEYASLALKVELRKLSRDDESEAEKVKQIVRMKDWLVARRFDFVRNYIRSMLGRGFRRQRMGTVIAELRLLRRQQGARQRFPAMIPDRG
jgi:hypothetical protein